MQSSSKDIYYLPFFKQVIWWQKNFCKDEMKLYEVLMMQSNEAFAHLWYFMTRVKLGMRGRDRLPGNTSFKVGPSVNITQDFGFNKIWSCISRITFTFLQQVQAISRDLQALERSRSRCKWQLKLEPGGSIQVLRATDIKRFGFVAEDNDH